MADHITPAGNATGYVPDGPDDRDLVYAVPRAVPHEFVDLCTTGFMPPVWDQGQLGSCTAHGSGAGFLFAAAKAGISDPMLSRLQIYYNARSLEGTVDQDSGAQIRDAIKACAAGVAPETDWPYDITRFRDAPPAQAVADAAQNVAVEYASVETSRAGIQAVLSEGYPIVNGLRLYSSFEGQQAIDTGIVKHPAVGEQVIGGHCMLIVGIGFGAEWKAAGQFPAADDHRLYVKVRNSWGTGVYENGYLLMGVPYQARFGNDFWVIRNVT